MFFFKKKNKRLEAVGEIVRFEEENGQHYPVFHFTTLDGKTYTLREIPKDSKLRELSLEEAYVESAVIERLNEPLPIYDILIKYNPEDPTDFYAIWV